MKFIERVFSALLCFQIVLFFLFVIRNITTLENVEVYFSLNETAYSIEINFYAVSAVIIAFYVIAILASIQFMGSGLSDEGTKALRQFVGFLSIIAILTITTSTFILPLGAIGIYLEILFGIIYLIYILTRSTKTDGDVA